MWHILTTATTTTTLNWNVNTMMTSLWHFLDGISGCGEKEISRPIINTKDNLIFFFSKKTCCYPLAGQARKRGCLVDHIFRENWNNSQTGQCRQEHDSHDMLVYIVWFLGVVIGVLQNACFLDLILLLSNICHNYFL